MTIAWIHIILHLIVYLHNTEKFIRQLIIPNSTLFYRPDLIMHTFPVIIGKRWCDVTGDMEAKQDCNFPFIHLCLQL